MKARAALLVLLSALALPCAARAQTIPHQTAPVSFSLSVSGSPDPGETFWVSYGPLAGKFAIVQLHRQTAHAYGATIDLPTQARGTFYYLTGHGTMKTRIGRVPGDPVSTIKEVGPLIVRRGTMVATSWRPPIG